MRLWGPGLQRGGLGALVPRAAPPAPPGACSTAAARGAPPSLCSVSAARELLGPFRASRGHTGEDVGRTALLRADGAADAGCGGCPAPASRRRLLAGAWPGGAAQCLCVRPPPPAPVVPYQYYLQVKKDVLEGRLRCSLEQAIRLAGLAVQVARRSSRKRLQTAKRWGDHSRRPELPPVPTGTPEAGGAVRRPVLSVWRHVTGPLLPADFGDYNQFDSQDFLREYVLFPMDLALEEAVLEELTQKVAQEHQAHSGVLPAEAELMYINEVERLDGFGQEVFPVKVRPGRAAAAVVGVRRAADRIFLQKVLLLPPLPLPVPPGCLQCDAHSVCWAGPEASTVGAVARPLPQATSQDNHGNSVHLGIFFMGIFVRSRVGRQAVMYRWGDVGNISHNKSTILAELVGKEETAQFHTDDIENAKYISRLFATRHKFYKQNKICTELRGPHVAQGSGALARGWCRGSGMAVRLYRPVAGAVGLPRPCVCPGPRSVLWVCPAVRLSRPVAGAVRLSWPVAVPCVCPGPWPCRASVPAFPQLGRSCVRP
ncbi:Tyrosine-protein phosphatase non-receptor type 14 [Galemys pyrenaicus]|uniref:protein-tyrosine-phosphatase n=1 Tax=Galemys pyrenaicus TaxID=202257 RepID=A0A8J5ZMM8_GALPY|nr:Tyrosine-protein phosphatase non-receptor type 14 [Galemys pyrenaicus]